MLFLSLIDSGARLVGSDESMEEDDQEEAAQEQQRQEVLRQRQAAQHQEEIRRQIQAEEEAAREEQHRQEVLRQRAAELLEQQRQEAEQLILEQQHQEEAAQEQQHQEEFLIQRQAEQNEFNFLVWQQQHQRGPFHQVERSTPKANDRARWSEKTKDDLREMNEEQRSHSRLMKRRSKCLSGYSNEEVQHASEEVQHASSAAQHRREMEVFNVLQRELNQDIHFNFQEQLD